MKIRNKKKSKISQSQNWAFSCILISSCLVNTDMRCYMYLWEIVFEFSHSITYIVSELYTMALRERNVFCFDAVLKHCFNTVLSFCFDAVLNETLHIPASIYRYIYYRFEVFEMTKISWLKTSKFFINFINRDIELNNFNGFCDGTTLRHKKPAGKLPNAIKYIHSLISLLAPSSSIFRSRSLIF